MVDATFNDLSFNYAMGFTIFYPGGNLWTASFRKIRPLGTILADELTSMNDGITFWLNQIPDLFCIFLDSIDAIYALYSYKGAEENLTRDVWNASTNTSVKGDWYCPRANNAMAHNLAKIASKSPLPQA